jgi:hypothetical protein
VAKIDSITPGVETISHDAWDDFRPTFKPKKGPRFRKTNGGRLTRREMSDAWIASE